MWVKIRASVSAAESADWRAKACSRRRAALRDLIRRAMGTHADVDRPRTPRSSASAPAQIARIGNEPQPDRPLGERLHKTNSPGGRGRSPTSSPSSGRSRRWRASGSSDSRCSLSSSPAVPARPARRPTTSSGRGTRPEQPREGVEVLRGDPHQAAAVADTLAFDHKYTSGVIAWAPDGAPSDAQIDAVLDCIRDRRPGRDWSPIATPGRRCYTARKRRWRPMSMSLPRGATWRPDGA